MIRRQAIFTGLILSLLFVQLLILVILALFPYLPDPGLSIANTDVYVFLAPLSTVFLLGLLYAWLIRLGTREGRRNSRRFERFVQFVAEAFRTLISSVQNQSLADSARSIKILSHPKLLLAVSIVTSVLLTLVPYRPDLNPTGNLVGIDSPLYVTWINKMVARPVPQALQYSFVEGLDGSRPLLLVILYAIASLAVSPTQIIEYLPAVLAPLLSLSTYIFVRSAQRSPGLAGLTTLFTPFSFYLTAGLWGGYYANMLVLIFVYLFLTILLLFSKFPSAPRFVAMFALSIALFLTHPWTWVLIVTASLVFAVSIWRETGFSVHLKSITAIIIAGIAVDLLKSTLFATRTVATDLATKVPSSEQVASILTNLVDGLFYTHGGLLGNWIILALGLLAMFTLRLKDWFERLVVLWVGVASLPFMVLDSYTQTRILYDLPIPVLMSSGLLFFLPAIGTRNIRWPGVIIVLVLVLCANYALRAMLLL